MIPKKLTEDVFSYLKREITNGGWTYAWKYPINRATKKRIKKSQTFQEYIGENGKYAKLT